MSIEQAAAAFDADMGNRSTSTIVKDPRPAPAEPIFSNLGDLEVDDESPARGGGDDKIPLREIQEGRKEVKRKAKESVNEEEDDDGLTDEERDLLGLPPRDPDEEADEESDGEDEEDADDEDDEDELLSKEFNVMVDGEEQKVTLKDALTNYSHRKALDQRMNFVEQGRNAVLQEAQNIIAQRGVIDQKLAEAEEILTALVPTEPNWDELFAKNPQQARDLQKQYEAFKTQLKAIRDKRAENAAAAEQMDTGETVKFRNSELRKFGMHAKWSSAKERDKDLASMRRTALATGFTEAEVGQVMDSRMLIILRKASKYDRIMAAKPRPSKNVRQQEPANSGAGRTRTAPKSNDRAMKNLRRTGSIEAAANVFDGILKRSR